MARQGKVSVIGAGFYGSTTAQRLAEYDVFDEIVLTDIIEGRPEGLALDMNQSRPIEGFETRVSGQTTSANGQGYEAVGGSDIVIITAGLPRKPGMSRMDLIETNARIVRGVTENVVKHAPDSVLIVVSNPLDEMTALAAKVSGFPPHRVLGQAGMLDTARFTSFVADRAGVPVGSVRTLTLGSHGDTMVPVPSACTVDGRPLTEVLPAADIEELVTRTRNGGGEVVALLKTGSAYYAPSAAAARMARAVAGDAGAVLPVCAWVDGQYGISGVYLGVEAEIGRTGVRRVVERDLTEAELAGLRTAAEAVRAKQADVASLLPPEGQAAPGQLGVERGPVGQRRVVEPRRRRVVGRRGGRFPVRRHRPGRDERPRHLLQHVGEVLGPGHRVRLGHRARGPEHVGRDGAGERRFRRVIDGHRVLVDVVCVGRDTVSISKIIY